MNQELPDVSPAFRKGRGTRDQITNIYWIIEKAREFQKNIYICFIDYTKAFDCVDHNKLWKVLKEGSNRLPYCLQRNLYIGQEATELDVKQLTGSKLGKACDKTVYCHPVYLTYMHTTSHEMLGLMNHKLEFRLPREIPTISDAQFIPL